MDGNSYGNGNSNLWGFQAREERGEALGEIVDGQREGSEHAGLHQPLAACFFLSGGRLVRVDLLRHEAVNDGDNRNAREEGPHHRPGGARLVPVMEILPEAVKKLSSFFRASGRISMKET